LLFPCIVCVATEAELDCRLSGRREYALFDAGLAVQNLLLQATREGLVAHPIAGFKPVEIKNLLGIPKKYTLITLVVLGYPGSLLRFQGYA
jgi:glutaredoxin-dependent peroxiredoxin